jgi:capsular polysaccharide biosynthesis protein
VDQQELDLLSIFRIIRRRLWLILAIPAAAAVTAGFFSFFVIQPVYAASTTLWVIKEGSTGQITLSDVQLSRNLTRTYAEVAKSRAVMLDVINTLGLNGTPVKDLQDKLTVTTVRDTEILAFTIEDTDPVMAARLANAAAVAFMEQIRTYMKLENVAVVDQALVPLEPIKPRKMMNIALATVLGGMAALGLVFLLEMLDTSIKSPDDVTRHLGLPVLGLIPVIEPKELPEPAVRRGRTRERNTKAVAER